MIDRKMIDRHVHKYIHKSSYMYWLMYVHKIPHIQWQSELLPTGQPEVEAGRADCGTEVKGMGKLFTAYPILMFEFLFKMP